MGTQDAGFAFQEANILENVNWRDLALRLICRVGIGGSMKTFLQSECVCPGIILVSSPIILLSNAQMMKVSRVSGVSHR